MLGSDTMEITAEGEREQNKGDNIIKKEIVSTTLLRVPTNTIQTHTHSTYNIYDSCPTARQKAKGWKKKTRRTKKIAGRS